MLESPEETSLINRAGVNVFIVISGHSNANLLSLTFKIALLPRASPLMNLRSIGSLALYFVVVKLSPILATVDVSHDSLAAFFTMNETSFVGDTIQYFFFSMPMRFGILPLSLIEEDLLPKVLSVLIQRTLSLELSPLASTLKECSVTENVYAIVALGTTVNECAKVEVALGKFEEER